MSRVTRFADRFGWTGITDRGMPLAIAHRGASDHAPENTLSAFRLAADLGAELWELDVRLSSDGVCMVVHDATLERVAGQDLAVANHTAAELARIALPEGEQVPTLSAVIDLAAELDCGLYIELKDPGAGPKVLQLLEDKGFRNAAIGAFDPRWIAALRATGTDYPLSVLVPRGVDPMDHAGPAHPDIIHLCWLGAQERPDALVTDALVQRIHATGAEIVTWHEDRPEVIASLATKPILGICSNRPEALKPARHVHGMSYVCHRGANDLAPENTIEAARICFDQGFDYVELDVRTTQDGHLVVMHDATLERTTDGTGLVCDSTLEDLRRLDAGKWMAAQFDGTAIPTLREMLAYARPRGGLYVEIKHASPSQILCEVQEAGMTDRCFFWGADTDALHWLRAQSDDIQLMAPRWMYASVAAARDAYRAQIIEFDVTRDDLSEVALCKDLGVKSMIFSLSHDWRDLASYLSYRPDLVNLDRPDRFKLIADYAWVP